MPRLDGIDVSKWQGSIDWPAVATTGIWWAACRVWDRDTGAPDATFKANRAGMAFARYRLLYDWLLPGQGREGAERFLSTVGTLAPGEGAMLDAEQDGITEADCLDWLYLVEAATARPAAVYTGGYVAGGAIWRSPYIFDGARPRVFAAYTTEADAHTHASGIAWDVWQWSSTEHVPGIAGNVDADQVDRSEVFDWCCGVLTPVVVSPLVRAGHARTMP